MKRQLFLILSLAINFCAYSQEDKTVTLIVSGQGKTIGEAKQNALRGAIEQSFGAFISSNTTILNDELVKDEIVSVSNGNIQNYKVISEVELPNGGYATTLKATVSITKLTSFAKSKGAKVEFKGGLFAVNMIQQELNEKAELKAVKNIINTSNTILKKSFDYSIASSGNPIIDGDDYEIPLRIKVKLNENFDMFRTYFNTSMRQLSMSTEEIKSYKETGKSFDLLLSYNQDNKTNPPKPVYFRNEKSLDYVNYFIKNLRDLILNFEINNGVNIITGNTLIPKYNFQPQGNIDLFRIYINRYEYYNSAGKPTWGEPSPEAVMPSLLFSGSRYRSNFILSRIDLNTSCGRLRLKKKYQKEIQKSNRNIILNFYDFYNSSSSTGFSRSEYMAIKNLKGTMRNEKSIIWISFYDKKTLDEINKISEYTIKPNYENKSKVSDKSNKSTPSKATISNETLSKIISNASASKTFRIKIQKNRTNINIRKKPIDGAVFGKVSGGEFYTVSDVLDIEKPIYLLKDDMILTDFKTGEKIEKPIDFKLSNVHEAINNTYYAELINVDKTINKVFIDKNKVKIEYNSWFYLEEMKGWIYSVFCEKI